MLMGNYKNISTDLKDGIGMIWLDRPEVNNAISIEMTEEILHAMECFDGNQDVKVMTVMGRGRMFSSGADIGEMKDADARDVMVRDQFRIWDRMAEITKPVISGVHKYAFGGGFELALLSDMIVAARDAGFGFPEVTIGAMPGAGGTQRLTRLAGTKRAMEWIMLGETISAKTLHDHGVINHLADGRLLEETVFKLAAKLAKQPQIALKLIKESVNAAQDHSLYAGMQIERKNFYLLFSTEDQKIGMQAFLDKKPPEFRGR